MKTVLIIGAGFSGTATAIQLLRLGAGKFRIVLVNRSGTVARGLAYGTQSAKHLLNVPAGNMSALADEPDHFLEYCRRIFPALESSAFVGRKLYGDYLESLLNEAERSNRDRVLERVVGEVVHIGYHMNRAEAVFSDGRKQAADRVVLAFGHYPPRHPHVEDPSFYESRRYIRDPWDRAAIAKIAPNDSVLLLGSGLTSLDVAINLFEHGPRRTIHAISRRGLLPQPHREARRHVPSRALPRNIVEEKNPSVRSLMRRIRAHIAEEKGNGRDWRETIGALRPLTQALWKNLPSTERARFLRHVQAFWETHRHRVAPGPHARFSKMIESGKLDIVAGRVCGYRYVGESVRVLFRPRGTAEAQTLDVDWVVNCTGPETDISKVDDALAKQLLRDGLIATDALGLGIEVDDDSAVIDTAGRKSQWMYYVGPLLKAKLWEATAVPELRVFAHRLAGRLAKEIDDDVKFDISQTT